MTNSARVFAIWVLLMGLFSARTNAATRTASSCNATDVQAAIKSAVAGDTVVIPAGTCTWTTRVSWTAPANVTLKGAGSESTVGGGDATVIIDNLNRSSGDSELLGITTPSSGTFRMTGITFRGSGSSSSLSWNGSIRLFGTSQAVRIDHVHLDRLTAVAMGIFNSVMGVFDHSIIDLANNTTNFGIRQAQASWGSDPLGYGDGAWATDTKLGTAESFYIENSVINGGSGPAFPFVNDCSSGGRFVIRYNTVNAAQIQTHGTGSGGRHRGCRAWEVYGNTFTGGSTTYAVYNAFYATSGTGVVWGNKIPGRYTNFVTAHVNRANSSTYPQTSTPNGWGYCGTAQTGTASLWDQRTDSSGYACIDQLGRGKGDRLINDSPNTVNQRTGTISWPNQVLEPVYEWLNTGWTSQAPTWPGKFWAVNESAQFAKDRDYYLATATFDGSSGVGSGLNSARPSACTPNVAYWATDTKTLYRCSAAKSWTTYYSPYAYPHPLTGGVSSPDSGSTTPAPPTNLQAISR